MTASAAPAFRETNIRETPLGRVGTVDEVTPLVVFLPSDESSFITGAEIPVDGGLTSHDGVRSVSDALLDGPRDEAAGREGRPGPGYGPRAGEGRGAPVRGRGCPGRRRRPPA